MIPWGTPDMTFELEIVPFIAIFIIIFMFAHNQ